MPSLKDLATSVVMAPFTGGLTTLAGLAGLRGAGVENIPIVDDIGDWLQANVLGGREREAIGSYLAPIQQADLYQRQLLEPSWQIGQQAAQQYAQQLLGGAYDIPTPGLQYADYALPSQMYQPGYVPEAFDSRFRPQIETQIARGLAPGAYEERIAEQMERVGGPSAFREQIETQIARGLEEPEEWSLARLADDPGYQFRLQEGKEAITGAAAARGGRLSGETLRELTEFGQGLASQEAEKAYGRFAAERGFGEQRRRQLLGDLLGERAWEYGAGRDVLADLLGERGWEEQMRQQTLGELLGERGFEYGAAQDLARAQERAEERGFGYWQDYRAQQEAERLAAQAMAQQEFLNRQAEMAARSGRLGELAGWAPQIGAQLGPQALTAAGITGALGAQRALAGKQAFQTGLQDLGQIMDLIGAGAALGQPRP